MQNSLLICNFLFANHCSMLARIRADNLQIEQIVREVSDNADTYTNAERFAVVNFQSLALTKRVFCHGAAAACRRASGRGQHARPRGGHTCCCGIWTSWTSMRPPPAWSVHTCTGCSATGCRCNPPTLAPHPTPLARASLVSGLLALLLVLPVPGFCGRSA